VIGLDTNVLVRFLVRDDPEQYQRAEAVFSALTAADQGYLSVVVLVETHWVLTRSYGFAASQALRALALLLDAVELVVQEAPAVRAALRAADRGADFADALISELASSAGCEATLTFDRRAARHAGMRML
jgi:predicted nucleic-acid-binding protein